MTWSRHVMTTFNTCGGHDAPSSPADNINKHVNKDEQHIDECPYESMS